ncbi:hypothetical protein ACP70R_033137 [Stipagrostis hirtigluma subsp. patula]
MAWEFAKQRVHELIHASPYELRCSSSSFRRSATPASCQRRCSPCRSRDQQLATAGTLWRWGCPFITRRPTAGRCGSSSGRGRRRLARARPSRRVSCRRRCSTTGAAHVDAFPFLVPDSAWASIVRAKAMAHAGDDDVYFLLSADCRRRLRPPVEEGYFGNCVMGCCARATLAELSRGGGDGGLVRAAAAIQRAIGEGLKDPMADVEGRLARRRELPAES